MRAVKLCTSKILQLELARADLYNGRKTVVAAAAV